MGLSIREIMKIEPFTKAKLLAGENGLDRVAEWANMQEVPDCVRWFYGKEIIFASGFAFKNAKNGCELMKKLDDIEVAALVIKPGEFLDEVPKEMIQLADEINMPLFSIPSDMPYMDFMIPIYERLMQEQLYVLKRVEQINEALTEEIFRENGIDGICRVLSDRTRSSVVIFAYQGNILASSSDEERIQDLEKFWGEYMKNMSVHERYLKKNKCNRLKYKEEKELLCIPVCAGEEILAYLLIESDVSQPETNYILLEKASSMAAIELLKEKAAIQEEEREKEQLLEDVLLKRYKDEEIILMRGKYIGFDFNKRYVFFVIDSQMAGKDISINNERLHDAVRKIINEKHFQCLMMNSGMSKITGMMTVGGDKKIEACRKMLEAVVKKMNQEYKKHHFYAGLSAYGIGLGDVSRCYEEAELAYKTGKAIGKKGENVSLYSNLGAFCFLAESKESEGMRRYYEEHFRKLLDYDMENNSQLIETLECFLNCGTNLRLTAEKLFIHKNSVIYRLKKIEALCDVSLSDYEVLFDFQLCLKLRIILE